MEQLGKGCWFRLLWGVAELRYFRQCWGLGWLWAGAQWWVTTGTQLSTLFSRKIEGWNSYEFIGFWNLHLDSGNWQIFMYPICKKKLRCKTVIGRMAMQSTWSEVLENLGGYFLLGKCFFGGWRICFGWFSWNIRDVFFLVGDSLKVLFFNTSNILKGLNDIMSGAYLFKKVSTKLAWGLWLLYTYTVMYIYLHTTLWNLT